MSRRAVRSGMVAVLLLGGTVFGRAALRSDGPVVRETVPTVVSTDPSDVRRVVITSVDGRVDVVREPDGRWTSGSGDSQKAAEVMALVETRLFPLRAYRSLAVDPSGPEFGLEKPAVVLDVEALGAPRRTVAFGGPTFTTGGFYAGLPSIPGRVFLVPRSVVEDLQSGIAGRLLERPDPRADEVARRVDKVNQHAQPRATPWLQQVLDSGADVPPARP